MVKTLPIRSDLKFHLHTELFVFRGKISLTLKWPKASNHFDVVKCLVIVINLVRHQFYRLFFYFFIYLKEKEIPWTKIQKYGRKYLAFFQQISIGSHNKKD